MRASVTALICLLAVPAAALAQPGAGMDATPLAVDLKKAPIGSWAEYSMTMGTQTMKSRWALVKRDSAGATIEMGMEGGPAGMMGGKMTMQMTLAPDPIAAKQPVKKVIMQMGTMDPMEMPLDERMQRQKFTKPDPKKLVGKETLKVAGTSINTSHYRDISERGTHDVWVSETIPPLGVVKMTLTPKDGAAGAGPGGRPMPPVTMELTGHGKDAKPTITKPAKPFDPSAFGGPMGAPGGGHGPDDGHGHGAPPPGAGAPASSPAAPPAKK